MLNFKESETQEEVEEEYDYMNEEPLEKTKTFEYEEDDGYQCD